MILIDNTVLSNFALIHQPESIKAAFVDDDKDARQWAVRLSIPHTGTLGILAILIKHGQIAHEEGNVWLDRMITAGYHSPLRTLDSLLTS